MILLAILKINRKLINNFITFLCTKIGRGSFDTECTNYSFSNRYKILNNLPIPKFTNYICRFLLYWVPICAKYVPRNWGPKFSVRLFCRLLFTLTILFEKLFTLTILFQKLFTSSTQFFLVCKNAKTCVKFR